MKLSVVIPMYNESENVRPLYESLCRALDASADPFELVFVDDGSSDGTWNELLAVGGQDGRVRAIRLRRNFGQTIAMSAGIENARGRIIVTMDGDLQNDPIDIPRLVAKVDEGYDLVTGWRKDRKDPMVFRKFPSKVANWLIRRITRVPIHDTGCSLKAYRAELIRQVPLYAELHRFIPAMCTMATTRFTEVVVTHHPRRFGSSKYGLGRIGRVLLDVMTVKMLISSASEPLHYFGRWAWICFLAAGVTGVVSLGSLVTGNLATTATLPLTTVLIFYLAVHLTITGVMGELIVRLGPGGRVEPLARTLDTKRKRP